MYSSWPAPRSVDFLAKRFQRQVGRLSCQIPGVWKVSSHIPGGGRGFSSSRGFRGEIAWGGFCYGNGLSDNRWVSFLMQGGDVGGVFKCRVACTCGNWCTDLTNIAEWNGRGAGEATVSGVASTRLVWNKLSNLKETLEGVSLGCHYPLSFPMPRAALHNYRSLLVAVSDFVFRCHCLC